jgi:lysyl-tRNA synthetase, class II
MAMSSEETLIQVRREKHQELNGGKYPLSSEYDSEEKILMWPIQAYFDKPDYIWGTENPLDYKMMVRGRVTAFRKAGGITFVKVTDSTGSLQIMFSKASYPSYEGLRLFDLGDIVEVVGKPTISKTGEKSIMADGMKLLTKAHRPPPEKFHGIADEELKYRKRYLDLMSSEESRARFMIRSMIVRAIREYMDGQGFMEVETSTLSSIVSGANAKPFETHHNALDIPLRLRIAPELNLKRLLVGGFERVYEIGRNYRNEGIDTRHNPEFTMMESYLAYGRFPELIVFTKSLLHHVINYCAFHLPEWAKTYFQQWRADRSNTFTTFAEVGVHEAVMAACTKAEIGLAMGGCELMCGSCVQCDVHSVEPWPTNNARRDKIDIAGLNYQLRQITSPGDKWMLLFEHLAEPFLTEDYRTEDGSKSLPVFITRYPKSACPLARANDHRTDECDRFELFVDGRELANAFQELNDPDEQARRFKEQLETNNKDPMAYDADYVEALQHGMPPAIGFGIGVDRLCILLTNAQSIKDVILFPTLRPVDNI